MNIGSKIMNKATVLAVNLVLLLATVVLLCIYGPGYFSNSDTPVVHRYLVYCLAVLAGLVFLWLAYKSRTNTYLTALVRPVLMVALVMAGVVVFGKIVPPSPVDPCNNLIKLSDDLRAEGDLEGAEHLLDQCVSQASEPVYVKDAKIRLAHIYLDEVEVLQSQGQLRCDDFVARMGEADLIAKQYSQSDLEQLISDKLEQIRVACSVVTVPTPRPDSYSLEILRIDNTGTTTVIDFRVIKNQTEQMINFTTGNFVLNQDNNPSKNFTFSSHTSDNPVCIVAVVDNSGSVSGGVGKIHDAINILNQNRKPKDELALVTFGDSAHVVRSPAAEDLQPDQISTIDGSEGLTALWLGVEQGMATATSCQSELRYLIVLTDGKNNTPPVEPMAKAHDLAIQARTEHINICPVGIRSNDLEEAPLILLATGCDYFEAAKLDNSSGEDLLATKFQEIIGYVHNFYRIEVANSDLSINAFLQLYVDNQFSAEAPIVIKP